MEVNKLIKDKNKLLMAIPVACLLYTSDAADE